MKHDKQEINPEKVEDLVRVGTKVIFCLEPFLTLCHHLTVFQSHVKEKFDQKFQDQQAGTATKSILEHPL